MCGIIGIAGKEIKKIEPRKIDAMLACLARRGPDDKGTMSFPTCILGQARLAIIDLSPGGHQPKKDNQRDCAITFNGEIYNYQALRKELEAKGHHFSSNSDTEVILKAYNEYGTDCPKHLDGMFAFALWDAEKKELFVARDRFGKKPFYYAFDKDRGMIFASEIKSVIASGFIKGKLDLEAVDAYLSLMYIPPNRTIYSNIHTLPPAHSGVYKNGTLVTSRYWSLEYKPLDISYEDAKKKTKELIVKAVEKRMMAADVEIGSFLSGGLDSTLATYYAQSFLSKPIKTFSVGYEGYINELPFAKEASEKIGSDHYTLQAKSDLTQELVSALRYLDEPNGDSSLFPQGLVSQLAESKVKVALSGDGADELFLGYGWYWKHWNLQKHQQVIHRIFSDPFKDYVKNMQIFSKKEKKQLWKTAPQENFPSIDFIVPKAINDSQVDPLTKMNLFDLTVYLPGQLLSKVDMMGMMHSLEVRCPFLDYELAEFVFNLPFEYKVDKKNGKIILKDILSEIMPKEFVYRRKQGFGAPVKEWLKKDSFKKLVYAKLANKNGLIYNTIGLNEEYVENLLADFYEKDNTKKHYKIWILLCLEIWLGEHKNSYE